MVTSWTPSAATVTVPRDGSADPDAAAPPLPPSSLPHPASRTTAAATAAALVPGPAVYLRVVGGTTVALPLIAREPYAPEGRPARDRRPSARRRPRCRR